MKKLLLMAVFAGFTYYGAVAQDVPGKSAYGHSHKKAKKAKKHTVNTKPANRKAINLQHRTAIKTATSNDALTNQQQRDQVKQANATHKAEIKGVTKTTGKKK